MKAGDKFIRTHAGGTPDIHPHQRAGYKSVVAFVYADHLLDEAGYMHMPHNVARFDNPVIKRGPDNGSDEKMQTYVFPY